jgi:hypothetical protein
MQCLFLHLGAPRKVSFAQLNYGRARVKYSPAASVRWFKILKMLVLLYVPMR